MSIKIKEKIFTKEENILKVFKNEIDSIENVSEEQFDACIKKAEEKGWSNWKEAFENWKLQGFIPKDEE